MGAAFGSGSSGNLFGATGSANFLSRATGFCATIFLLCTLGLAFYSRAGVEAESGGVMEAIQASPAEGTATLRRPSRLSQKRPCRTFQSNSLRSNVLQQQYADVVELVDTLS